MINTPSVLDKIKDPRHRMALEWFHERTSQEVPWPEPLDGLYLANKAKGIHKPADLTYALSVRQSLSGHYEDGIRLDDEGRWIFTYAQEGSDPGFFTNLALNACRVDKVPVGVMIQVKPKPDPLYEILGLGLVTDFDGRHFTIRQMDGGDNNLADSALVLSVPSTEFDASNAADGRTQMIRGIAVRRGQPEFRRNLMRAYSHKCAVSGCSVPQVLEAAHIMPYMGNHTNHVQNGLLLRADLHTLFDLGLLSIAPDTHTVVVSSLLEGSAYWDYHGKKINLPQRKADWPSTAALLSRLTK